MTGWASRNSTTIWQHHRRERRNLKKSLPKRRKSGRHLSLHLSVQPPGQHQEFRECTWSFWFGGGRRLTADRAHKFCPCSVCPLSYVYICHQWTYVSVWILWIWTYGSATLAEWTYVLNLCVMCIYMCDVLYVWICLSFLNVFIWLNDVIWMFIYVLSEFLAVSLSAVNSLLWTNSEGTNVWTP